MSEKIEKSAPESGENKELIKVILAALQVVFLIVLVFQMYSLNQKFDVITGDVPSGDDAAPAAAPTAPSKPLDMKSLIDDDAVKGSASAPVTIVEFSDYQCPFCARFYQQTLPQIQENYIDTGKVKFIYRDYPLASIHPLAQKAAEAAECAGEQGKYFDMHDMLFTKGVTGGVEAYKQFAADLKLDTAKFNECLDSGKMAAEISKDTQDGNAAGVQGTPAFIINGQIISGAQPYANFQAAIDAALNAN